MTARLWDVAKGKQLATFEGHKVIHRTTGLPNSILDERRELVNAVAFSPDGKTVAVGGQAGKINLWDPATGKEHEPIPDEMGVYDLRFSPDGKTLALLGANEVQLWDVTARKRIAKIDADSFVAFAPDGKTVAARGRKNQGVSLYDAGTGKEVAALSADKHHGYPRCAAFSPDGKSLVWPSKGIQFWDPAAKKVRETPATGFDTEGVVGLGNLNVLALSPDGKTLAASCDGGLNRHWHTILLWDVGAGKRRAKLHVGPGRSGHAPMAFSPDSKILATAGSDDGAITLWRLGGG
jgi:WD40 repeat protein